MFGKAQQTPSSFFPHPPRHFEKYELSNLVTMVNPKQQSEKLSVGDFEADFEADYGISSKKLTAEPLNGAEGKPVPDISEARDQPGTSEEKPSVEYIEDNRTPH
jgi:hypothetical protein